MVVAARSALDLTERAHDRAPDHASDNAPGHARDRAPAHARDHAPDHALGRCRVRVATRSSACVKWSRRRPDWGRRRVHVPDAGPVVARSRERSVRLRETRGEARAGAVRCESLGRARQRSAPDRRRPSGRQPLLTRPAGGSVSGELGSGTSVGGRGSHGGEGACGRRCPGVEAPPRPGRTGVEGHRHRAREGDRRQEQGSRRGGDHGRRRDHTPGPGDRAITTVALGGRQDAGTCLMRTNGRPTSEPLRATDHVDHLRAKDGGWSVSQA